MEIKKWWKSKTIIINSILILLATVFEILVYKEQDVRVITGEYASYVIIIIAIINQVLRLYTTKPIGK
ncbi:MAG: hypothetical protein IE909_05970 [Campylobacterales bacterium]|nr:hypothetical protein [Campylobacterales bacterium]